ncbi:hypothetical protein B296_00005428 [Ensete ventricosum]|uniref:Uncharacterized protein n=1 Tax=Ensete ventricosum TaxID=4639 RepID=A0A427A7V8_ENSVE|nr:hypothetical protein B296_00005428 [Ensete ventricosum]
MPGQTPRRPDESTSTRQPEDYVDVHIDNPDTPDRRPHWSVLVSYSQSSVSSIEIVETSESIARRRAIHVVRLKVFRTPLEIDPANSPSRGAATSRSPIASSSFPDAALAQHCASSLGPCAMIDHTGERDSDALAACTHHTDKMASGEEGMSILGAERAGGSEGDREGGREALGEQRQSLRGLKGGDLATILPMDGWITASGHTDNKQPL